MDKQKLDRANELNSFIENYQTTIYRYYNDENGMSSIDGSRLGNAILNIAKYVPDEANIIKKAIKNAFDNIQKEFDKL